jgi:hypothetical protein
MPLIVCTAWGIASTYLFFYCWLGVLGLVACLIGGTRQTANGRVLVAVGFTYACQTLALALLLILGFRQICGVHGFGYTPTQVFLYWAASTLALCRLLPGARQKIDRIWEKTNPEDEE